MERIGRRRDAAIPAILASTWRGPGGVNLEHSIPLSDQYGAGAEPLEASTGGIGHAAGLTPSGHAKTIKASGDGLLTSQARPRRRVAGGLQARLARRREARKGRAHAVRPRSGLARPDRARA
jgi:hypothetical protein